MELMSNLALAKSCLLNNETDLLWLGLLNGPVDLLCFCLRQLRHLGRLMFGVLNSWTKM